MKGNRMKVIVLCVIIVVSIKCNINSQYKNVIKCEEDYFENDSTKGVFLKKCLVSTIDSTYHFEYFFHNSKILKESYFCNKNGKQGDFIKFRDCSVLYPEFLYCKVETGSFLNGKLHGSFIRWSNDSVKWDEQVFKDGIRHGFFIMYHSNGSIKSRELYNNGVHGKYSYKYDENGKVIGIDEFDEKGKYLQIINPDSQLFQTLSNEGLNSLGTDTLLNR
jgi:antitoxin component YwqK of YwqJK toxin-antitoxin module